MKDIRFRIWNGKEMVSVKSIDFDDAGNLYHVNKEVVNPLEVKLLQYTGLKDRNGTEIYEGDIIAYYKEPERASAYIYWDDDLTMVLAKDLGDYGEIVSGMNEIETERLIVSGNIYESPKMINEHFK